MTKNGTRLILNLFFILTLLFLTACSQQPWNNPYPSNQAKKNILYTSFSTPPKTLDPAKSYSSDETQFIAQIYEPPLQYHYLKRPYTLVPLTLSTMPTITYLDKNGKKLPQDVPRSSIAFSIYELTVKPGIYYQFHPAFAKKKNGSYWYHNLSGHREAVNQLADFKQVGTRELIAEDYIYEIKRLAQPGINSPIYELMKTKILGLQEFRNRLIQQSTYPSRLKSLREYPLAGAKTIDRYRYRIILNGHYPQFIYWLSMPFFAPIPWEADVFYDQPGMQAKNITFDWYPVGTGPYTLIENNPNRRMVLQKNLLFHDEYFPREGFTTADIEAGFLRNAGKKIPFIDQAIFSLEKESIPRWNKFLQGYYDLSTISSDSFDQAIRIDQAGQPVLTPTLQKCGIRLRTTTTPTLIYIGFNMLDKVIGGKSERARKLRLAMSIAVDFDEYINLFLNGRGTPAQGPLPPGIFGSLQGAAAINPFIYEWSPRGPLRKSITIAKNLMREAGYPNGIDPKTNEPLLLNYDALITSGPEEKMFLDWMRQQFAKIGIQLNIRGTEYNRFQEKIRVGHSQIYMWAWAADYPDPENFLFLLYGPNSKVKSGGENTANYQNQRYDDLFDQMKGLPNNRDRLQIIQQMLMIARHDAPWIWGVNPKEFVLSHTWNAPFKSNVVSYNTLKYQQVNPLLREQLQKKWNKVILWPLALLFFLALLFGLPVMIRYWQKERFSIKRTTRS